MLTVFQFPERGGGGTMSGRWNHHSVSRGRRREICAVPWAGAKF